MENNFKKFLIWFAPRRVFQAKSKARFLAAFDARYGAARGATFRLTFVMKTAAAVAGIFAAVLGGVSVYADTANVPADNILYPWKRLTESIQLAAAPAGKKAELQATLVARRVAEIDDLESRKPTSTIIAKLQDDANDAVNASIVSAADADLRDGSLTGLCGNLLSAIAASSTIFQGDLENRTDLIARFTDRCEEASGQTEARHQPANQRFFDGFATTSNTGSATATGMISATGTASGPAGLPEDLLRGTQGGAPSFDRGAELKNQIKHYLNRYFELPDQSASSWSASDDNPDATTTANFDNTFGRLLQSNSDH